MVGTLPLKETILAITSGGTILCPEGEATNKNFQLFLDQDSNPRLQQTSLCHSRSQTMHK